MCTGLGTLITCVSLSHQCHLSRGNTLLRKALSLKPSGLHSRSHLQMFPLVRKLLFMESGNLVNIWTASTCRQETWFIFFFPCQLGLICRKLGLEVEFNTSPKSRNQRKPEWQSKLPEHKSSCPLIEKYTVLCARECRKSSLLSPNKAFYSNNVGACLGITAG